MMPSSLDSWHFGFNLKIYSRDYLKCNGFYAANIIIIRINSYNSYNNNNNNNPVCPSKLQVLPLLKFYNKLKSYVVINIQMSNANRQFPTIIK